MTNEQKFIAEFEAWVTSQVAINELAMTASQKVVDEDGDDRAKEEHCSCCNGSCCCAAALSGVDNHYILYGMSR